MSILADAVIEAMLYISTAPSRADRDDADARVLENLVLILRDCDAGDRDALREALIRVRPTANDRDRLDALNALESDILGEEAD